MLSTKHQLVLNVNIWQRTNWRHFAFFLASSSEKPQSLDVNTASPKASDFCHSRAWLFKTNNVISKCFVKISDVNIWNLPIFFVEKNVRSFCSAKVSLIFSTKNISVFGYKVIKHLMSWPLNELVKPMMFDGWNRRGEVRTVDTGDMLISLSGMQENECIFGINTIQLHE